MLDCSILILRFNNVGGIECLRITWLLLGDKFSYTLKGNE